jgi:hypothetical protein
VAGKALPLNLKPDAHLEFGCYKKKKSDAAKIGCVAKRDGQEARSFFGCGHR